MGICRNCGAKETQDLGFIGQIAPFVLKRVLNVEHGYPASRSGLKRLARRFGVARQMADRLYGKSVLTEMEICGKCSFLQMKHPFPETSVARLYEDYRSESYNRERIHYEPTYASLAPQVGRCAQEIEERTTGLTRWLTPKVSVDSHFSMLDYGGADGRFLPQLPGAKYVFEISNVQPVSGVTRINSEAELGTYSYVQLAHVLEHVPNPANLTREAARHVADSGYLYIEVPQELSDAELARLANGDKTLTVTIHEHINWYSQKSVRELLQSAGLSIEAMNSEQVNFGWTAGTVIRALARPKRN